MIKHLSLFSGIESFKKAMDNLDINNELVGYSEIDKYASVALAAIHGISEDLNYGDITKIDETKLPDCDLITYGFPCQDISVAGLGKGIVEGETRSGLLYDALRIIKHKMPKYAIAENVKNLVGKRFKDNFNSLLEELDSYGYNNYWQVLNAKDYGIPQNRERVFIVSIRKDVDKGYEFPKPYDSGLRLKDLLLDEVEDKYYIENERANELIERLKDDKKGSYPNVGDGKNELQLFTNLSGGKWDKFYESARRVYDESGIAPTLLAGGVGPKVQTNYRIRKLKPKECWRLMGFTDEDYRKARKALEKEFYNGKDRSNSQMYKMAGNSIVVDVLEEIFRNLPKEKYQNIIYN